jgi:hypothetical protein
MAPIIDNARMERFLQAYANLTPEPQAFARFRNKYPDLYPNFDTLRNLTDERYMNEMFSRQRGVLLPPGEPSEEKAELFFFNKCLVPVQRWIRSIWMNPDRRVKLWLMLPLLQAIGAKSRLQPGLEMFERQVFGAPRFDPFPAPEPFETALWHLVESGDRTHLCANQACKHPFFFAGHGAQKFCSPECAEPSMRRAKLKWWREHGKAWLKKRARSEASAKKDKRIGGK